jgi:hypothetical protein
VHLLPGRQAYLPFRRLVAEYTVHFSRAAELPALRGRCGNASRPRKLHRRTQRDTIAMRQKPVAVLLKR